MTRPQDQPIQQDKPVLNFGDVAEPGTLGTGRMSAPIALALARLAARLALHVEVQAR